MNDKTYDAIYELLYDEADNVIKDEVLGKIDPRCFNADEFIDIDEWVKELRMNIRGYAIRKMEDALTEALDSAYYGKILIENITDAAKMGWFEYIYGATYFDVEVRHKSNGRLVDGFTEYGTLDEVCNSMEMYLTDNERVGDTPWDKLKAIVSVGGIQVAVMPSLDTPDYEIVANIDLSKGLED